MKNAKTHINDFGQITIKFADRCHEYRSAKIPLYPSVLKTIRTQDADNGALPHTNQITYVGGSDLHEILILN